MQLFVMYWLLTFYYATHTCIARLCCHNMSGCVSHAGIVSKWLKISFFLGLVALPLWFSNTALWLQNSNGKGSLSLRSDNAEQWQCCTTLRPADTLILPPHTVVRRRSTCRYISSLQMISCRASSDTGLLYPATHIL